MRPAFLLLALAAPVLAQQPRSSSGQPPRFSEDQIRILFQQIGARAARLQPMIEGIHAGEWVSKGAPDAYVSQQKSMLEQLTAVQTDMSVLAQHPDQMTDTMKALFRVQSVHRLLGTLLGGVRRYQNPAVADLIDSVAAEDQSDLDRVEVYLIDLAGQKEQELQAMDSEAQRCRGILLRQPAPPKPGPFHD
jgi:hypothetical protein